MSDSNQNKDIDIPTPSDFPSRFLRALLKSTMLVTVYLVTLILTSVAKGFFPIPVVFLIIYLCIILAAISVVGAFDMYSLNNILTGFAIAYGLLIIDPNNFISTNIL
jgi:uncharacterized membrane protein